MFSSNIQAIENSAYKDVSIFRWKIIWDDRSQNQLSLHSSIWLAKGGQRRDAENTGNFHSFDALRRSHVFFWTAPQRTVPVDFFSTVHLSYVGFP